MRILTVLFYSGLIIFIGLILVIFSIAISYNWLMPQDINSVFLSLKNSLASRLIMGFSGLLLVIISVSFAQLILGRFGREKTIVFMTSNGQVSIALSAVEDLIRRLAGILPEVKELRPDVISTKKGLVINSRVVLKTETNIFELTAHLEDIIKSKIQEVLGSGEQIIIKIHIAKIVSQEEKDRKLTEEETAAMPFGRYGRV